MRRSIVLCLILGLFCSIENLQAEVKTIPDVEYANVDGHSLQLDLYLPEGVEQPPLVVWIHGGGWRKGTRKNPRIEWITQDGYALASISYRLTDKAIFPAQIHDCKGAIRWLRANAEKYGYNADKIVIAGSSAGGMLVALLGVSADVKELEGDVGGNLDQSSRVQGIVDYFGAHDFILRSKTQPAKTSSPEGSVYLLLGGPVEEKLELAKQASAVTHVTQDDPPLLILHGSEDTTVLPAQAHRLESVYQEAGLPVELMMLEGLGHGGNGFNAPEIEQKVREFITQHSK
ncbi:MAG: alpha/beta hydrolase [Planctomycetaceae bacterium]|nr:alpha/beta hydrolase [Planctomycetaceae bacterium]